LWIFFKTKLTNILFVFSEKNQLVPTEEELLEGRTNMEAWQYMCEVALKPVVGKLNYEDNKSTKLVSEIATNSDEAFAIVLLLNIRDQANVIFERRNQDEDNRSRTGLPDTRWTNKDSSRSRRYGGWPPEALKRYNEIYTLVVGDRTENKDIEEDFMKSHSKSGRKRKADGLEIVVETFDDL
jgi:hypothetical protein